MIPAQVVFTQDVLGEREWLLQQFPGFETLETEFNCRWPSQYPTQSNTALIWEIPPDSKLDPSKVQGQTYRSVFTHDRYLDSRWCHSDNLLCNLTFNTGPKSDTAWVLHFPRSATVFLESVLTRNGNYQTVLPHCGPSPVDDININVYKTLHDKKPDVYINYRKDWWSFTSSLLIALHTDYYHYHTAPNWSTIQPFDIDIQELDQVENIVMSIWNFLCSTRTMFPNLRFYIYEFDDIVKHSTLTKHRAIDYSKQSLIKNYQELEQAFNQTYLTRFTNYQTRCIKHLVNMGCQVKKNFDHFAVA